MTDNFEKEITIDATGLGLVAYYRHPESIEHYVSYPVTEILVDFEYNSPNRQRRSFLSNEAFLSSGFLGKFSSGMPQGAEDLMTHYGLMDYVDNYLLGIFRDSDEDAKALLLRCLTPWDQEETGEILKHTGTANPTKPFEYFWEPEK